MTSVEQSKTRMQVLLLLCLVVVVGVSNSQQMYTWNTEWSQGTIGGWQVTPGDWYVAGTWGSSNTMLAFFNPGAGCAAVQTWNPGTYSWGPWYSKCNHYLCPCPNSWTMSSSDIYGDLGNNQLLTLNTATRSAFVQSLLYRCMGPNYLEWFADWGTLGGGVIGGWVMGSTSGADKYLTGWLDLSSGKTSKSLLCVRASDGRAGLEYFNGFTFGETWSNNSRIGQIGDWTITASDRFFAADFDGDGKDELLCVNFSWAMLLKYQNGSWTKLWQNNGFRGMGDWGFLAGDVYLAGKFIANDGKAQFMCVNPTYGWAMIQDFNGSTWSWKWHNGGNNYIGEYSISWGGVLFAAAISTPATQARFIATSAPVYMLRCDTLVGGYAPAALNTRSQASTEFLNIAHSMGQSEIQGQNRSKEPAIDETSVKSSPAISDLFEAFPNPFNPSTQIEFTILKDGFVHLGVFNVLGQEVATLIDGQCSAGGHTATWSPTSAGSGVYFARLTSFDGTSGVSITKTKKLLFAK